MIENRVILKTKDGRSLVQIEKGELISYQFNREELIHQKGSPGWKILIRKCSQLLVQ